MLGKRFHLLLYDSLCNNPEPELRKLLGFLGCEADTDQLILLVGPSPGQGRYREHDLAVFSDEELTEVEKPSFTIP